MNFKNIVVALFFGFCVHIASAQTPATPVAPEPPAAAPAIPPAAALPAIPAPPAAPKSTIVEGTLIRSQRANDDRGKFTWICTFNVAGSKRNVQLDESCPATLPFDLRR